MPEEADDLVSQARQSANWLVGLSGAFIGGALAKLDWVQKFPTSGKINFLVASFFFLISICAAVYYTFQLFPLKQRKEALDKAKSADPLDVAAVDKAATELTKARKKIGGYSDATLGFFLVGGIFALICLGCVLLGSDPPPLPKLPVPPNHFTLVTVPVQISGRLDHYHTFLLNQQNGEMWRMTCRSDKTVDFRQVERIDLDGAIEEQKPPSKPDAPKPAK